MDRKIITSGQESCHNINIINKYNNMTCPGDEKNKKEKDLEIEKIFHELGINYTDTNEIYTSKILEILDGNKEFLKIYLERIYKEISRLPAVKNIAALFRVRIKEINYSLIENIKNKNKLKEKEIQETRKEEEKVRKKILKNFHIVSAILYFEKCLTLRIIGVPYVKYKTNELEVRISKSACFRKEKIEELRLNLQIQANRDFLKLFINKTKNMIENKKKIDIR